MSFPFSGKQFTFVQPDGTQIQVRGWGDQYQAVFETLDGFTIIKDPDTGYYHYASVTEDGHNLAPSGVRVGATEPAALGLGTHLRISRASAKMKAHAAYRKMGQKRRTEVRRERYKEKLRESIMMRGLNAAPPTSQTKGQYIGLCLLIQFPDVTATISQQEVNDFCNKKGYAGYGNNGSVLDYFFDVSNGKLTYTNIVSPYYTTNKPRNYYTNPTIDMPTRTCELINEALLNLKANGFDFSQLSTDDEGYVYALNVYYAGNRVNNWAEGLWPHSWHLDMPLELTPGKLAFDYQITDMGQELTLGTFCHENGHMVCDFPDLYDYGYQSAGTGHYCLMCTGGANDKNPSQVCAYLKYKAGWAKKVASISGDIQETLSSAENQFLICAKNPAEYFIIENRYQEKRDEALPDSGLAIWHVDELGSNNNEQMTESKHYECSLEQADSEFGLEKNVNYGDDQDLFAHPQRFADDTNPNSRWWDGTPSRLEIFDISAPGGQMSLKAKLTGDQIRIFEKRSATGKAIPDNDPIGVKDVIEFFEEASIVSVKVGIDITHPYRGDLRILLTAPSGDQVVLFDKKGGVLNDLKTTFDAASAPALGILTGQSILGQWMIHVQDLGFNDIGQFNSWELHIRGQVGATNETTFTMEESPGIKIPDRNPSGIRRTLVADKVGQVKDVSVSVDISHTYIGDLVVSLTSPSGTSIDLHKRGGGSQDNLVKTYDLATTPAMSALTNEPIQGKWSLKVADLENHDIGKLNRWSVKIIPKPL